MDHYRRSRLLRPRCCCCHLPAALHLGAARTARRLAHAVVARAVRRRIRCRVIRHSPRPLTPAWPSRAAVLQLRLANRVDRHGPNSTDKLWMPA